MQKPVQIGITGGIGSGKSLVCLIFAKLGVPVYDADSRAKMVMTTDGILVEQIKKEFGTLSYNAKGDLNRAYLSERVFGDAGKLKQLNSLVHPRVALDYKQWVEEHANATYVLKEAALMFESGSNQVLDKVIVVSAPEVLRIKRIRLRDPQRTPQQIEEIMKNQLNEKEKIALADYVVTNDETTLLIPQVILLHQKFTA